MTLLERFGARFLGWEFARVRISHYGRHEWAVLRIHQSRRLGDVVYVWTAIAGGFRRDSDAARIPVRLSNFEHERLGVRK